MSITHGIHCFLRMFTKLQSMHAGLIQLPARPNSQYLPARHAFLVGLVTILYTSDANQPTMAYRGLPLLRLVICPSLDVIQFLLSIHPLKRPLKALTVSYDVKWLWEKPTI